MDITDLAIEAGFGFPFAFSKAAYAVLEAPEDVVAQWDQTTEDRLWNFLVIARLTALTTPTNAQSIEVHAHAASGVSGEPEDASHIKTFVMMIEPDDEMLACITVKMPSEVADA